MALFKSAMKPADIPKVENGKPLGLEGFDDINVEEMVEELKQIELSKSSDELKQIEPSENLKESVRTAVTRKVSTNIAYAVIHVHA